MAGTLLSSNWYRVAELRPRLRAQARLHRHRYRGQLWYLLQDPASNRVHRFAPSARLFIAAMDGRRTVEALWALTQRRLGEEAPTQDEIIHLLGQLHAADLLQSDVTPDSAEVFDRGERQRRGTRLRSALNPIALRMHVWDPQALLDRIAPISHRLWSRTGALLWLAVCLPALALLPAHWGELGNNFSDRVLAVDNLLLLWLVFPLIKLAHEMGHAVATHRGGGEVHDMGVVLLVLIPVPYVEASAANVFKSKAERAMVSAAGMAVELFIAALAFYGWLLVEPGTARALLFNVMLVAGVSTVVFNGNPLLRYDAYYILADLIEMPNLASRSLRYWGYLAERHAFGAKDAEAPEGSAGERAWMLAYGLASSIYRVLVTVSIALFIATQFFFIGVLLALWAVASMALWPLFKGFRHLATAPALHRQRSRAWGVALGALAVLGLGLFAVPAPSFSIAEGVIWLPEQSQVRTAHEGFLDDFAATPGTPVQAGQLLARTRDARLAAQRAQAEARVAELQAQYGAQFVADRAGAALVREQLEAESTALDELRRREAGQALHAAVAGVFVVPRAADLPGRFLRRGDLLGYVIPQDAPAAALARVVVPQETVDLVRGDTRAVAVRFAHHPQALIPGRIVREVPRADEYLPSRALATEGGGQIATDPRDTKGARTLERTFQFDIALQDAAASGQVPPPAYYGERVHVRFEHARQPLGWQGLHAARRLFLSHFQW